MDWRDVRLSERTIKVTHCKARCAGTRLAPITDSLTMWLSPLGSSNCAAHTILTDFVNRVKRHTNQCLQAQNAYFPLSVSCPSQLPLVVSGVVKCRQRVSGAIIEIRRGGDCPFVPANCPPRTETGLDYSYSALARAFDGETQARPTPCANSSNLRTSCGADFPSVACLRKEVGYALWGQGGRRRLSSSAPARVAILQIWSSASFRSLRRCTRSAIRSAMASGGRSSGRWCASSSSAAISNTDLPASVALGAARNSWSRFPAGAVVSARVATRNGRWRRRAGSASTSAPRCRIGNSCSRFPKRLRIYFRFDRRLLGELCRAAARTVITVYRAASGRPDAVPGMVGAIQTFGQLVHFHPHIHALVSEGVFLPDCCSDSCPLPKLATEPFLKLWEQEVFALLLAEGKITEDVVANMRSWKHSGSAWTRACGWRPAIRKGCSASSNISCAAPSARPG